MSWEPMTLWDCLDDSEVDDRGYQWKKECRRTANCYVCYYQGKEIGFIPVQYSETDVEWQNWWDAAYERHNNNLTLRLIMDEIVDRHQRRIGT